MATTRMVSSGISPSRRSPFLRGCDALTLLFALVNVGLVLFDLSYIRGRDLYFRYLPQLPQHYDALKGIQPHHDTAEYLATVDQLQGVIDASGTDNEQVRVLFAQLGDRSVAMITEDPFRIANKSGNLEKLKNRMRQHMGNPSAKAAFQAFWSPQHFNNQNWRQEMAFFDRQFRPLIATNYYRHIDESGEFVDQFWKIDRWFMGFFALDILARVLWIRHHHRTRWTEAMLWRWYDCFFLLPFWQILRIIPLTIRLHQAQWVNLATIQNQINRNLAENIAAEVTELVLIQTFSVVQGTVQQGALRQLLSTSPQIVDTNQIDELAVIGRRLVEVLNQNVLPQLQPDFEALIRHFLEQAIAQTPIYQTLRPLPGLNQLSQDLSKQVAHQVIQTLSNTLNAGLNDETGQTIVQQLGQHFMTHLQKGLTQKQTLEEIETLLITWIEELKLTLVQNLQDHPPNQTLAQAESIRQLQWTHPVEILPKRGVKN